MTRILFSLMALAAAVLMAAPAAAVPTDADVSLESAGDSEVTLVSAAVAPKSGDARTLAVEQAFYALLHQGVEGFRSGMPMLSDDRNDFEYSFYKSRGYERFLAANPVKLDEVKVGSSRRVRMSVTIRYSALLAMLRNAKLALTAAWSLSKKGAQPMSPTIVVVPYVAGSDLSFEGMRNLVDRSPAMKHAVDEVAAMFARHGYKTRDFRTMLQNSRTDDVLLDGTQTDARTLVVRQLPGDIVATVDLSVICDGRRRSSCAVGISAVERQTAGRLASASFASGEYMTTDTLRLASYALGKVEDGFFSQIRDAFSSMAQQGREMAVEFALAETVGDWDFDSATPATACDFKETLEEWLRSTAQNETYDMSASTDRYLAVRLNIPLWDHEKNRSYTISNFNSALKEFLRTHLGDGYGTRFTAMGQKLVVTIE